MRRMILVTSYIKSLDEIFVSHTNPENAHFMKKYMKNKFEFFGIQTTQRRELTRHFLKKENLPTVDKLESVIKKLWAKPQREYQYFGVELVEKYTKQLNRSNLLLIEYMITKKSWWDTVDSIAIRIVGEIFRNLPELILPETEKWMDSRNIWLQRTALLFQLKYKSSTDTDLLFGYITALGGSDEFFINKAIGWALREYSKTDPDLVVRFVNSHNLAPLSKREALKVINKSTQ
jgi:3-methyladenine DNA glycosylase AlkD